MTIRFHSLCVAAIVIDFSFCLAAIVMRFEQN